MLQSRQNSPPLRESCLPEGSARPRFAPPQPWCELRWTVHRVVPESFATRSCRKRHLRSVVIARPHTSQTTAAGHVAYFSIQVTWLQPSRRGFGQQNKSHWYDYYDAGRSPPAHYEVPLMFCGTGEKTPVKLGGALCICCAVWLCIASACCAQGAQPDGGPPLRSHVRFAPSAASPTSTHSATASKLALPAPRKKSAFPKDAAAKPASV